MNFSKRYRVKSGHSAHLHKINPADTHGYEKEAAKEIIAKNAALLFKYQNHLYAENRRALLIVLQGMDTSGKDGVIRNVMTGFNPQGITVTSFKAPSSEELDHDFLWRIHKAVPAKGDIAVFNRSHYEDVLIARVRKLVANPVWKVRYDQINAFEQMLSQSGTRILKFFLHISEDEQRERLIARVQDPEKNWKFNPNDLKERLLWDEYIEAYEDTLGRCSTKEAPWFIIPSNKKWFRNLAISNIILETLAEMNPQLPPPNPALKKLKIV